MRCDVETDLVVALAGAAVRDGVGILLRRDLDEQLRDEWPGERGRQRIGTLVERVRLEVRPHEVGHEALPRVDHVGTRRAGRHRSRFDALAQRTAADVDGERHDLGPVLLLEPGNGNRGVETARVGEHDLLHLMGTSGNGWDGQFGRQGGRRGGEALQPAEPLEPALEAIFVGEQDEQRIVARERAFLFMEGRLVDRLGHDARGAGRAGQHEDQPAAPDA